VLDLISHSWKDAINKAPVIESVRTHRFKPGEKIVLQFRPGAVQPERDELYELVRAIRKWSGGHEVLILNNRMEMVIISSEESR